MAPGSYPLLFGRFPDYYKLLEIDPAATKKDVHTAYKKAALAAHPDKAGNTAEQNELCAAINNAKAVLMDVQQRRDYDFILKSSTAPRPPPQATKARQQHEPTFTASSHSSKPRYEPRPDGAASGSGSTRWDSGSGARSGHTSAGKTKPFGNGPGFGPERNACGASKSKFTDSSRASNNASDFGNHSYKDAAYGPAPNFSSAFNNASGPSSHSFKDDACPRSTESSRTSDNDDTSSSQSYQNRKYPSAGCPVCDSLWCPGAAHRHHARLDEIPCNNRGPRGFAAKPAFGHGKQNQSQSASGCTRGDGCPVHPVTFPGDEDDKRWKEPEIMGDPNYIEPNCSPAFGNFAPPASAYNRGQHNGTKPDSASWRQARWRCFNLSEEHQNTVDVAFSLCNLAGTTERTGGDFVMACTQAQHSMRGEPLQRLVACVDLINEILFFVAASYKFHALGVDGAAFKRPSVAIPQLMEIREQLEVIMAAMSATNIFLSCLAEKLCQPHPYPLSAEIVLDGLKSVIVEWDRSIVLPDSLTQAAQEIFFSRKGSFQNSFARLANTSGYPCKPFMFKDRTPSQWSREADGTTLGEWEGARRRREGQMPTHNGFTPNTWGNGTGYLPNHNWNWAPAEDLDDW